MAQKETVVHPTAIIEEGAQLGAGSYIGPYSLIGANVKLGSDVHVQSHAVITGHTTLGDACQVFPFASVGNTPQDKKYRGEPTTLVLGDRNVIRENVTMQPGTVTGINQTVIGDGNLFMAYTHVAHDCVIGDNNVIANGVQLAGHVTLGNHILLGGLSAIHQFCSVGDFAVTSGGSIVVGDLPPYCIAQGDRATLRGLNLIGMRRAGFSAADIRTIQDVYKTLFTEGFTTVNEAASACEEKGYLQNEKVVSLVEFVKKSQRGVVRPEKS